MFKIGDEIITVSDRPMVGLITDIWDRRDNAPMYQCQMNSHSKENIYWSFWEHEIRRSDNHIFNESFDKMLS